MPVNSNQIITSGVGASITAVTVVLTSGPALGLTLGAVIFFMLLFVQSQNSPPQQASPPDLSEFETTRSPKVKKGGKAKKQQTPKPKKVVKAPVPAQAEDEDEEEEEVAPAPVPVPEPAAKKKKKKSSSSAKAATNKAEEEPPKQPVAAKKATKKQTQQQKQQQQQEQPPQEEELTAKQRKKARKKAAAEAEEKTAPVQGALAGVTYEVAPEELDLSQWTTQEESYQTKKKNKRAAVGSAATPAAAAASSVLTDLMKIPIDQHKYLIGAKAATLHKIQEVSGTNIEFPSQKRPSTEVVIKGSAEGIVAAKRIMTDIIQKGFSVELHGPGIVSEELKLAAKDVGRIVGPSREFLKAIEAHSGVKDIRIPPKKERGEQSSGAAPDVTVSFLGTAEAVAKAKHTITELLTQGYSPVTHKTFRRLEIQVPKEDLTYIIGKGGNTIQNIQKKAPSCRITVPDRKSGGDIVVVVGPSEEVKIAEVLIKKALEPKDEEPEEEDNELDADGFNPWQRVEVERF